jgi:hypothetical protein
MAEETDDISIKVAIDTADADKSIKQIKQSLKDLKNVKAGDKLFEDAQKAAAKYKDKLDDIKDAAGAAAGSGVEKLTSSMNLLKDGFVNADPGKLSIGMKGLGAAMKAIPIFLIIEGIKFLVENFEKLASGGGIVGKVFTAIGEVVGAVIQYFKDLSDSLGLSSFAAEDNAERTIAAAKATEAAVTGKYDAEIRMAKAAGKETIDLEIKKQEAVIQSLQLQQKALEVLAQASGKGATIKQLEEWSKLGDLVRAAQFEIDIIKTTAETKANEDAKKYQQQRNDDLKESLKEQAQIANDAIKEREQNDANELKATEELLKKAETLKVHSAEEQLALNKKRAEEEIDALFEASNRSTAAYDASVKAKIDIEKTYQTDLAAIKKKGVDDAAAAKKKADDDTAAAQKTADDKAKAERDKQNKDILASINSLASSAQTILSAISDYNQAKADQAIKVNEQALQTQLSDLDAARDAELNKEGLTADQKIGIENKYKQQKYELELQEYNNNTKIKRKAFEQDKKMKIAQAVISTITGAIAAVTGMISAIPGPVGIILGVVAGLAVTAAGVLQVAKINNTTFDAGTPPSPPTLNVPSASSVSTGSAASSASATPSFDLFKKDTNQNGANNNASSEGANQPMVVKAYVVSQEITDQQTANNYSTSMGSL